MLNCWSSLRWLQGLGELCVLGGFCIGRHSALWARAQYFPGWWLNLRTVQHWFFLHWASHWLCRYCVRLGLSVGSVYMMGAEDNSGQTRWYADWENNKSMQLQRGVRLGSQTTYAALWVSSSEVWLMWKLWLRVQVSYSYSLYTWRVVDESVC